MSKFNRGRIESALKRQYVELDTVLRGELDRFYDKHQSDEVTIELIESIIQQVANAQYELGAERQKRCIEDNNILTKKAFQYPIPKGTAEEKAKFVREFFVKIN